ncbi:gliding motility-associated C-terminal domain-containing protein [Chitinophagales bacterium]|nr:gliding motility-associated C-terminal domain-containing protein [Chitinophagales bacterium]
MVINNSSWFRRSTAALKQLALVATCCVCLSVIGQTDSATFSASNCSLQQLELPRELVSGKDHFKVSTETTCNQEGYKLKIYNQWGEEVFSSADFLNSISWSGIHLESGRPLSPGNYFYIIEEQNETVTRQRNGFIRLISAI